MAVTYHVWHVCEGRSEPFNYATVRADIAAVRWLKMAPPKPALRSLVHREDPADRLWDKPVVPDRTLQRRLSVDPPFASSEQTTVEY
jgi:hypothetical protein